MTSKISFVYLFLFFIASASSTTYTTDESAELEAYRIAKLGYLISSAQTHKDSDTKEITKEPNPEPDDRDNIREPNPEPDYREDMPISEHDIQFVKDVKQERSEI